MIFNNYNKTKEYLDRQQKIDYLLVLAKLLEPGSKITEDNEKLVNEKIKRTLDDIK